MSPLQSTCLSHWFKDRLDSTMRDLGCCAQNIKGTSMKGFRMLTKFWPCHYGSWKLRRPGAHEKATEVIGKKTGPCNYGNSNGPLRVVKSPRTSEKIVIFGHSKVWEELLMTFLVQLWAKQQNEPYTIHLFESWIQDTLIKLLRW